MTVTKETNPGDVLEYFKGILGQDQACSGNLFDQSSYNALVLLFHVAESTRRPSPPNICIKYSERVVLDWKNRLEDRQRLSYYMMKLGLGSSPLAPIPLSLELAPPPAHSFVSASWKKWFKVEFERWSDFISGQDHQAVRVTIKPTGTVFYFDDAVTGGLSGNNDSHLFGPDDIPTWHYWKEGATKGFLWDVLTGVGIPFPYENGE